MIFLFFVFFKTLTRSSLGALRATVRTFRNAAADLVLPRYSSLRRALCSLTVLTIDGHDSSLHNVVSRSVLKLVRFTLMPRSKESRLTASSTVLAVTVSTEAEKSTEVKCCRDMIMAPVSCLLAVLISCCSSDAIVVKLVFSLDNV
uniref:Secreted protein n=1 Tax=Cacopsylla melanoneura TaxID=428564 RepID=A0A8D8UB66_9HEMI